MMPTYQDFSGMERPSILCPADVADMIYIVDDRLYNRAHQEFLKATDVDSRRLRDAQSRAFVESLFAEWLTYEKEIEDRGMRATPFRMISECLRENGDIDGRQLGDLREIDRTNIASCFWIREANAASRRLVLEDLVHDDVYEVRNAPIAAEWDGTSGGAMIARIARARGTWRLVSPPVASLRGPSDGTLLDGLRADAHAYHPHYLDLLRAVLGDGIGGWCKAGAFAGGMGGRSAGGASDAFRRPRGRCGGDRPQRRDDRAKRRGKAWDGRR